MNKEQKDNDWDEMLTRVWVTLLLLSYEREAQLQSEMVMDLYLANPY